LARAGEPRETARHKIVGAHRSPVREWHARRGTRAPEPQAVDRGFAARPPRGIDWVRVQQHLRFIEQGGPALARLSARSYGEVDVASGGVERRGGRMGGKLQ